MGRRMGNGRDRDADTDSVYEEEGHVVVEIFDDVSLGNEMQKLREEKEVQNTKMQYSCETNSRKAFWGGYTV